VLFIAWCTIRNRKGAFAGTFIALAMATALVSAFGILLESGVRYNKPAERLAGASIIVEARQALQVPDEDALPLPERARLDTHDVVRLARLSGVRTTIQEVSFPAYLVQHGAVVPGASLGHSWESAAITPYTLMSGRAPVRSNEIAVDSGLAGRAHALVGDQIVVQATSRPATYTITGIVTPPSSHSNMATAAIFFAHAEASRLYDHAGQIDLVGLFVAPDANTETVYHQVQSSIAGSNLVAYAGSGRGQAEFSDVTQTRQTLIQMSGSVGGIALMVALFIVAGMLSLTMYQRRREIALLRAVGATSGQVRWMLTAETIMVAIAAGCVGVVPGIWVASWLRQLLVTNGLVPASLSLHISALPFAAAVVTMLLASVAATLIAGRRISRIKPTEALLESSIEQRGLGGVRFALGFGLLGLGVVILILALGSQGSNATDAAGFIVMILAVAIALLGPVVARISMRPIGWMLTQLAPITGFLAATNMAANSLRLASAITPLILAVGLTSTFVFIQTTGIHAAEAQASAGQISDFVLLPGATPGLPFQLEQDIRHAVPGTDVSGVIQTQILTRYNQLTGTSLDPFSASGVSAEDLSRNLDVAVKTGNVANLSGNTVALSEGLAQAMNARVGSNVSLWLGDGSLEHLSVVAIYTRGLGFGDVMLPYALVASHVTAPLDSTILVKANGSSAESLEATLHSLQQNYPDMQVVGRTEFRAQQQGALRQSAQLTYLVLGVIISFMAISVVNILVRVTSERVREFALLRLTGMSRGQILGMMTGEALIIFLVAVMWGLLIATVTLVPLSRGLTGSLVPFTPPAILFGIIGGCALLAGLSTIAAAVLGLRAAATLAISYRE
jgi:putative ABC transport system permease protein